MLNTHILPTWCPGCGNFGIWGSLKSAIETSRLPLEKFVLVYDIGCSGNMSSFIKTYAIHGLHGRSIPLARGIILAKPDLKVIVVAGDGGLLGEGLNHFIHSARANIDITVILHNNQMYSLTTGQSSPTSQIGSMGKSSPTPVSDKPLEPVGLAVISGANFVARAFSPNIPETTTFILEAIKSPGFSFLEVLQPCVTYNKLNTQGWYKERLKPLVTKPASDIQAIEMVTWSDTSINYGIFKQIS